MNDIDKLEGIDLALAVARAQGHELVEWRAEGDWHIVKRAESGLVVYESLPRPDQDLNAAIALPCERALNISITPDGLAKVNYDGLWTDLPPAIPATAVCRAWLLWQEAQAARQADEARDDR
jgi:hypothetical protein